MKSKNKIKKMFKKQKKQQEETAKAQRYLRFLFIGSEGSGTKTSFVEKLAGAKGNPVYKEVFVRETNFVLELWDSPDESVNDADCVVIGYDLTDRDPYNSALYGSEGVFKRNPNALRVVIGNKLDLVGDRKVSVSEGRILTDVANASVYCEGIGPLHLLFVR